MCGICGVVQLGGEPRDVIDSAALLRMTDVMTHRGPDDRGVYEAPGVALGMRRLAIVDVEGGQQPVTNERSDVWAIQNGELYNHQQLRRELDASGHRLHTRCDTEVIPHLYEDLDARFPVQLRGMFGIAVWDARRRRAVIARDRLGIKPLYWAHAGDLLVFASELKSLLASGLVDGELDYDAIDAYLTLGFVPAPRTPLAGVSKLMPGHVLVAEDGGVQIERYWSYPQPLVGSPPQREEEYAEGLLDALEEAVRLRLMSDVPLGAMLSGGLDSSLIVGLMARNMSSPVKTFSVGFAEEQDANELADAREVASFFGTEHHELSSPSATTRSTWQSSCGVSTSRSQTSPRSGSRRSHEWLRNTSPSRSADRAPTSCWAAIESTRRRRSSAPRSTCRRRCATRAPRWPPTDRAARGVLRGPWPHRIRRHVSSR